MSYSLEKVSLYVKSNFWGILIKIFLSISHEMCSNFLCASTESVGYASIVFKTNTVKEKTTKSLMRKMSICYPPVQLAASEIYLMTWTNKEKLKYCSTKYNKTEKKVRKDCIIMKLNFSLVLFILGIALSTKPQMGRYRGKLYND